jgi:hypothetical protein
MTKTRGVDYVAPTCMLASLLVAMGCAVGHHFFYSSLDGTHVPDDAYKVFSTSISKQQANIGIGTALAFGFKAALVFSVSVSFIQAFWQTVKTSNQSRVVQLGQLDSAYSALDNFLTIANPLTWWRYPLPLLVALVAWSVLSRSTTQTPLTLHSGQVDPNRVHHHASHSIHSKSSPDSVTDKLDGCPQPRLRKPEFSW